MARRLRGYGFAMPAQRRLALDIVVIFGAALLVRIATFDLDLFERLYEFSRSHESWELDELFITMVIMSAALIVFGIRRVQDQRRETRLRLAAERQALRQAQYDRLTGLPNRQRFREIVAALPPKSGVFDAILLIDLDGFTPINDTLGQAAGDHALHMIARRLKALGPERMTCARVGGDEFALLVEDITSLPDTERIAARALAAVAAPIQMAGEEHQLRASLGAAVIDYRNGTPEAHLRHANLALHRAKKQARSSYVLYDASMDAALEERLRTERELRRAIAAGQVVPHYQPIVELATGRIIKFEALARWCHPTEGMVHPLHFIPIAEEGGLIQELTDALLKQVCADVRHWPRGLTVAVNLSPVLFESTTYPLRLAAFLERAGLKWGQLELEITERALEADIGIARSFVDQLRGLGVRFSLDDFGTGYSSLARLQGLQFDALKIDASFVQNMTHNSDALVIVRSIIELGRGLKMDLTAEGIETPEQREALIAEGCDHGQGYLFGRPVAAAEAIKMLHAQRRTPQLATDDYGRRTVA